MRLRAYLPLAMTAATLFAPLAAHAGIPFFGPIIPPQSVSGIQGSDVCAAGWGMLIIVINNIISLLITIAITFVAPIMIAYAGFLFVVNPVNASGISEAKSILKNTIVGIVIALAGYVIVSAVMAVLYHPDNSTGWGTWTELITSGNLTNTACLPQNGSLSAATQANTSGVSSVGYIPPLDGSAGPGCNTGTVQAAANAAGLSLSSNQASALACISNYEDGCGRGAVKNSQWGILNSNGLASSAAGAWQLLLYGHWDCWNNSVCQSVPNATGSIDCRKGFATNGMPTGDQTILNECIARASSITCAAAAAACTLLQRPTGSDWASAGDVSCRTRYLQ